jgi:hypothetical protein
MTSRDRFHATFEYGQPDRVFLWPQGCFNETLHRWRGEGMPVGQHFNSYFGFDRIEKVPLNPGYTEDLDAVWPRPATTIVQRSPEWQIIENELGGRYKAWVDREIGMSQWLAFPVRDETSWREFRRWLNPEQPSRYPEHWQDLLRCYRGRDYPLGVSAGSFYGWIRDWVGMENLALWYYDRPGLVHEMVEYVADFVLRWTRRALDEIPDIDYAYIWEDMCMKTGPLISPQLFREFHLEPMKRVIAAYRQAGIKLIFLDSDGNVDALLPLWLEAGVNLVYPIEAAAGCDPVRYRQQHGRELRMVGGMDKRVLRDGMTRKQIEEEVGAKAGLIKDGGYSPQIDHGIPPDVSFQNFRYYLQLVHEACGFSR